MPINGLYNSRNASEKYSPFKEMSVFLLTFWFWLVQVRCKKNELLLIHV